jgi:hypothetical protein
MGNVYQVFADVFHPAGSPAPYNANIAPGGPYFKYRIIFTKLGHDAAARALVKTADNANLTFFGSGFDLNEITNTLGTGELDKGVAELWMGQEVIDFEQPTGDYKVDVYAIDHTNNCSLPLSNTFLYEPLGGIEVDFNAINYGGVNLNIEKTIPGDLDWDAIGTNDATVRNIGNTWVHVTVAQDDMAFGKAGALPGTSYQGPRAPVGSESNWNVYFDLRMGNDPINEMWFDPTAKGQAKTNVVKLPNYLGLSTMDELDFSINVKNGDSTHTGTMVLGYAIEPFTSAVPTGGVASHTVPGA